MGESDLTQMFRRVNARAVGSALSRAARVVVPVRPSKILLAPSIGRFSSTLGNLDPTNIDDFESDDRHVLTALVTNEPGTLAHLANILSARGYNIDSLVVGRTEIPELSRVTVVVEGSENVMNQVQRQLDDLICVVVTERLSYAKREADGFVERDFMIIKVKTGSPAETSTLLEATKVYGATVIDFTAGKTHPGRTNMMISLSGVPADLEKFITLCERHEVVELARTGVVAMQRGEKGLSSLISTGQLVEQHAVSKMDLAGDLPPG